MLSVIMLSVIMLRVIMLSVIMLNGTTLSVVMLNVKTLSVAVPTLRGHHNTGINYSLLLVLFFRSIRRGFSRIR
jgi:hypothetical protein